MARALAGRVHRTIGGAGRRASVALVLRDGPGGRLELLFMLRAQNENDPWSGHVSFPGGRSEPGDASALATAMRETLEETGLDLARDAEVLGALDEVPALARGRPVDLVISPFVFHLRRPASGAPSGEVVSLHWLPLERLLSPEVQSTLEYRQHGERVRRLPSLEIEGLVIWGLTYHMFQDLLAVVRTAPPGARQP
jgi:8-oxo-dGTP pyrophosphatase MutT (NUDIX family)